MLGGLMHAVNPTPQDAGVLSLVAAFLLVYLLIFFFFFSNGSTDEVGGLPAVRPLTHRQGG